MPRSATGLGAKTWPDARDPPEGLGAATAGAVAASTSAAAIDRTLEVLLMRGTLPSLPIRSQPRADVNALTVQAGPDVLIRCGVAAEELRVEVDVRRRGELFARLESRGPSRGAITDRGLEL